MSVHHGWLFDAYPRIGGMTVWLLDREGRTRCFADDTFHPAFALAGSAAQIETVSQFLRRHEVRLRWQEGFDLALNETIRVLRVEVADPLHYPVLVKHLVQRFRELSFYNCDVPLSQLYFMTTGSFPLAFCRIEETNGRMVALEVQDSPWALDYELPPLRVMGVRFADEGCNPHHGESGNLQVSTGDEHYELDRTSAREVIATFAGLLARHDPDLILSEWGDSYIIPRLLDHAARLNVRLGLNRDTAREVQRRPAKSYHSYGRMIYKAASHTLFGRWHIDRKNALHLDDYGFAGLLEYARITRIPVQQAARSSPGTGISTMQLAVAWNQNILIPWRKRQPEAFKSALDLLTTDKGGLVYQPVSGLHENVAEIDFSSMYPAIMVQFNVSPETVGCACCLDNKVPEIGYNVCQQRRGLVPLTLQPLLEKRMQYKHLIREMPDGYTREVLRCRQMAQKWLLVCCFGYLGYKNARFGRIEAHEAVTAFGREKLLQTKEVAEAMGFRMLHAVVDAVWVTKPGATGAEYGQLVEAIERATGMSVALEGIYRWIAFPPSRVNPNATVANRYFGAFSNGEVKMRGIEVRRDDTPPFVVEMQERMIGLLATAASAAEYRQRLEEVLLLANDTLQLLRSGTMPREELVISKRLSKKPSQYTVNAHTAIVARALAAQGVHLSPGERVRYIVVNHKAKRPADRVRAFEHCDDSTPYDAEMYADLLLRSVEVLFSPLGLGREDWSASLSLDILSSKVKR
ncbi:MAG: hypothetical protein KDI03_09310 [Anaerolineae bacterium]|nr:hypothetical protein [Anaerolineae bacterium]